MAIIKLETIIKADIQCCFDLSRSIDLHKIAAVKTAEKAIDGRTAGLINLGEFIKWEAVHFGIKHKLTSRITEFKQPFHFRDEQEQGIFNYLRHDHDFVARNEYVIMKDIFEFQSPLGLIGKLVDKIFMTKYLENFLTERNIIIKEFVESDKWKLILGT